MNKPMLQKSRSIYYDGHLYDRYEKGALGYSRDSEADVAFFSQYALESKGKILELSCGTGRVAIALAHQGMQVAGLDKADSMLAAAQEKSSSVTWVRGDMRQFDLNETFDLILIPYNGFLHLLTLQEAQSCLACVKRHLNRGGKLILDIMHPTREYLAKLSLYSDRMVSSVFEDPDQNELVVVNTERTYVASRKVLTMRRCYHYQTSHRQIVEAEEFRVYAHSDIKMLLQDSGFAIESVFGGFDYSSFCETSPEQIVVAY